MHDVHRLLYGSDPTQRIVSVELAGQDRVRLYFRDADDTIRQEEDEFIPWLVTTETGASAAGALATVDRLAGELPLNVRLTFPTWRAYQQTWDLLNERNLPVHRLGSSIDQYLASTGRTLFKGMTFDDLVRMQIDIETTSLAATGEESAILAIAVSTNRGHECVLSRNESGEAELFHGLTDLIRQIDPDVIEGHNIFNFDLPFLIERARVHGAKLDWGRDKSAPRQHGTQRFKAGARAIPFQGASIFGRHIIDTYQQIQRYDYAGEMQSYGLKEAVDALGLTRPNRVFVPGASIASTWEQERDTILAYALDDVRDVALLSSLATPTEFYQTQILPRSFQSVAVGGPGEKINTLMTRVYLSLNHSLPVAEPPQPYPGGYTEIRGVGVFRPVVKCDVESLYPAIMLSDHIGPASDVLGVYLPLLDTLTTTRLDAKRMSRVTVGAERAQWMGLQSSFKVLINSFSGYMGYSRGLFNDYTAVTRVTLRGQDIIRQVVAELERAGAEPIEIDTDGVYFRPPGGVSGLAAEEEFVRTLSERLPEGINLSHDGTFRGMASLRTKNYALLSEDDRVILKGSGLRSRREERFLRRFLSHAARLFMAESTQSVRELYLDVAESIQLRRLPLEDIARWETITEKTFTSDSNRRIADVATGERIGERVAIYQRTGGGLARIDDYQGDEDVDYLLRRLNDMGRRFEPLFTDQVEFEHTFPKVTSQTDLGTLRDQQPARQMSLF